MRTESVREELRRFLMCQLLFGTAMVVVLAALLLSWHMVVVSMESACPETTEEEARERVMRHPFWSVEMDAQAVNEMADAIVTDKEEDVLVFVSEDGELVIDTDPARFDRPSRC